MTEKNNIPEMMNEGQKNILSWLQDNPPINEILENIEQLKILAGYDEKGVQHEVKLRGEEKLSPEIIEQFRKEQAATNYLLTLALDLVARQKDDLPGYEAILSSAQFYQFNELINYHSKQRKINTTKNARKKTNGHKEIIYSPIENGYSVTQTDMQTGSVVITAFNNLEQIAKSGRGVKKCFTFLLAQFNKQNFSHEIGFSLDELVERGMYSNTTNARAGIKTAMDTLQSIQFSGSIKKGNKEIRQEAGVLFYHYSIKNSYVNVFVNENMNVEYFASYFALIPIFAYKLNDNAFDLCLFIFMQARQNGDKLKENGSFNISLRKIRELLALPLAEDIAGKYKPKQYVIDPILNALEKVKTAAQEANNFDFTIKPHLKENYKNIDEWLDGYLEIVLTGNIYKSIVDIEQRKTQKIKKMYAMQQKKQKKND